MRSPSWYIPRIGVESERVVARPSGAYPKKMARRTLAAAGALMVYKINFFDPFDRLVGSMTFEAPNDQAAILIADGLARTSSDERRGKLWNEDRVIKLYLYKSA